MRPRTVVLTARQRRLRDLLLSPASGRMICAELGIKPSQLANGAKDVYRKLGYRNRIDMLAWERRRLDSLLTKTATTYR